MSQIEKPGMNWCRERKTPCWVFVSEEGNRRRRN